MNQKTRLSPTARPRNAIGKIWRIFAWPFRLLAWPFLFVFHEYIDPYLTGKWYKFYLARIDRNIGWIMLAEQLKLKDARVGIAGTGGMGGLLLAILARLGILHLVCADNDTYETSNMNRQFGAFRYTLGENKAKVMKRMLRSMLGKNQVDIIAFEKGITEETVDEFVQLSDVIADEVEFWAGGSRALLHRTARKYGITVFNCPTVGHRVYAFRFTPDSMTFEEALRMSYEELQTVQQNMQNGTASPEEIRHFMNRMLGFAAPEVPEYSTNLHRFSTKQQLEHRLFKENRASIIATNPPMAAGFLANLILFYLLEKLSDVPRNFVVVPPMPGYVMFDAALLTTKIVHTKWWEDSEKKNEATPIVISRAGSESERGEALQYTRRKYAERFGTIPGPVDIYLVARRNGAIVGTVGFEFPDAGGRLSIPDGYHFDQKQIPSLASVENSAQTSRWSSDPTDSSLVSLALVYGVSVYAKKFGKDYLWVEQDPPAHRILKREGITFDDIEGAEIIWENINENDRAYYKDRRPSPSIMNPAQAIQVLSVKMQEHRSKRSIVFDEQVFT